MSVDSPSHGNRVLHKLSFPFLKASWDLKVRGSWWLWPSTPVLPGGVAGWQQVSRDVDGAGLSFPAIRSKPSGVPGRSLTIQSSRARWVQSVS